MCVCGVIALAWRCHWRCHVANGPSTWLFIAVVAGDVCVVCCWFAPCWGCCGFSGWLLALEVGWLLVSASSLALPISRSWLFSPSSPSSPKWS